MNQSHAIVEINMRLDRFFTVIAALVAFLAVRFGDAANVWWKAGELAIKAGDGSCSRLVLGLMFLVTSICLLGCLSKYFDAGHAEDYEYLDTHENIALTTGASFCGFYLYAFIVGPLNNQNASWLDGWALIALAGAVPTVLNATYWIREVYGNRRPKVVAAAPEENVIDMIDVSPRE